MINIDNFNFFINSLIKFAPNYESYPNVLSNTKYNSDSSYYEILLLTLEYFNEIDKHDINLINEFLEYFANYYFTIHDFKNCFKKLNIKIVNDSLLYFIVSGIKYGFSDSINTELLKDKYLYKLNIDINKTFKKHIDDIIVKNFKNINIDYICKTKIFYQPKIKLSYIENSDKSFFNNTTDAIIKYNDILQKYNNLKHNFSNYQLNEIYIYISDFRNQFFIKAGAKYVSEVLFICDLDLENINNNIYRRDTNSLLNNYILKLHRIENLIITNYDYTNSFDIPEFNFEVLNNLNDQNLLKQIYKILYIQFDTKLLNIDNIKEIIYNDIISIDKIKMNNEYKNSFNDYIFELKLLKEYILNIIEELKGSGFE